MDDGAIDRSRQYWDQTHAAPEVEAHDNIFSHPLIHAYVSLRAFGELTDHLDAFAVALRERTRPGEQILSVGSGLGVKERVLAAAVPDRHFVGIDIAPKTVEKAREQAAAAGLRNLSFEVADFNRLDLEPERFASVLGLGAIHHVEELEHFWQQARRGLRRGGSVLAQEYIGPDRFQWTEAQVREGDRVLATMLPPHHKVHHWQVVAPTWEHMVSSDPSEAARSSEIVSTCRASGLVVTALEQTGCSLLQPVLLGQIATFDPRNWEHNLLLARLFAEEDRLIQEGVLGHDFAMLVAVKND